jgi:hypothetical protein
LKTCKAASRPRGQGALRQQFSVCVEAAAGPNVEFALARAMLIFLDEVRSEGMVVYHVGLELDGCSGRAGRQLEGPGLSGPGEPGFGAEP